MPLVSQKQRNLAELVAHDPERAKRLGIKMPPKVAKEFIKATPSLKNKDLPVRKK